MAKDRNLIAQTTLADGAIATLEWDEFVPGAAQLLVDGTPQSHIHPGRPDELFFAYIRRIGHVLDALAPASQPLTAVHLGGGAFTLPRYIEATRPGSSQQIIELSGELVDFVREHFPLPKNARIRIRRGDARAVAAKLPAGLHGACHAVIVDVFHGAQTPKHITSVEFFETLRPLLAPGGVIIVNAADGQGMQFVRSQLATLKSLFEQVAAIGEPQVLKGRRFGNVILMASDGSADWSWLPRAMNAGPHPARLLDGQELTDFIAGAKPVHDEGATPSPKPPVGLFN